MAVGVLVLVLVTVGVGVLVLVKVAVGVPGVLVGEGVPIYSIAPISGKVPLLFPK